jgi:hypothetical protein
MFRLVYFKLSHKFENAQLLHLQKFGFGYSPRQMHGAGEKREGNVKGFVKVTETCAVTEGERGVVERI